MAASDILVIIPSYGHFDFVRRAILSLNWSLTDQAELPDYIVIDDASDEWDTVDWSKFPIPECHKFHFTTHAGLTRSWNYGLAFARDAHYKYTICANSDLVFGSGAIGHLVKALDTGISLVGPLTNAPGHCRWQDVRPFLTQETNIVLDDSSESIIRISKVLASCRIGPIECPLNGFCLAALTDSWWRGAYDCKSVFNPSFPLDGNEVELGTRWYHLGLRKAMVPQSYVFHYRSVSRADGLAGKVAEGAVRPIAPFS
jgi:GT2 family glycosyltransferase